MTVYLYKIWSGYDGFTPQAVSSRLQRGDLLNLGWSIYADVVEEDDEVWVFFKHGQRFTPGVYVKGVVHEVDPTVQNLVLRVTNRSTTTPLVTGDLALRISEIVQPKRRQVFVLPADLQVPGWCRMTSPGAPTCAQRRCKDCPLWQRLPRVKRPDRRLPRRMPNGYASFVSGYWAVPRRSFIEQSGKPLRKGVRRGQDLFKRFKAGEKELAYPLAAVMQRQLAAVGVRDVDGIVPVPLSPEKIAGHELDRTGTLASELARLMESKVLPALSLSQPVGRRQMKAMSYSDSDFEQQYRAALEVANDQLPISGSILVLDDACTDGSTLRVVYQAIHAARPKLELHAASAALMAVKTTVKNEEALLSS